MLNVKGTESRQADHSYGNAAFHKLPVHFPYNVKCVLARDTNASYLSNHNSNDHNR